jgi:hypothetical protein
MRTEKASMNYSSSMGERDRDLGKVDGTSDIIDGTKKRQERSTNIIPTDNEIEEQVNDIRKLLKKDIKGKPATFGDMMNLMGRPVFQNEGRIFEDEFKKLVRARGGNEDIFTNHDIKMVFNRYAE